MIKRLRTVLCAGAFRMLLSAYCNAVFSVSIFFFMVSI